MCKKAYLAFILYVKVTWQTEMGVIIKCEQGVIDFFIVLCVYIVVISP